LAGRRELTVLFEPDPHTSLSYHAWTRNHLILHTLSDVKSRLEVLTPGEHGWDRAPLPGVPEFGHTDVDDTDPDHSDEYLLTSSGYTEPAALHYGHVGGETETLKQQPAFFDADDITVRQLFATSADGTRVPYFVVGPADTA